VAKPVSRIRRRGEKKHLLWLIDSLTMGGAERLVPNFARAYDKNRFELEVACLKELGGNPIADELAEMGVPVTVINSRNLRDAAAFRRLVVFIRQRGFDIIHTHLTYADIWGRLAGRIIGVPVVSTLHVEHYGGENVSEQRGRAIEKLADCVRRQIGDSVIAVSDSMRRNFIEKGYREDRLVTIYNGIDLDKFRLPADFSHSKARAEFGISASSPVVATVSVLREGKGHELLLPAAERVLKAEKNARFLIVGGGPLENALRQKAADAGLEKNVIFTGMRHDVVNLLALSDIFVLPSTRDQLPTVFLEAMAMNLPAIGLNSGGVPEMVADGETGIIVQSPDAGELSEAILKLLQDSETARAMGGKGRQRVEREFSALVWAQKLQELYGKVIKA
jgi:glycosyltransferase involved in cell wall biosynthesis